MGQLVEGHAPGSEAPPRKAKRKRRLGRAVLALTILLALAWVLLFQPSWVRFFDRPITFWPDEPGYTRYLSHDHEWTLRFPASWHAAHIAERGPRLGNYHPATYGVFISNLKLHEGEVWREGMPSRVVAVRVVADFPGGILFDQFCNHDTKLPLQLSNAARSSADVRDDAAGPVQASWHPFAIRGIGVYSVRAWFGSKASPRDRASAEAIVQSIRFPTGVGLDGSFNGCPIEDKLKKFGGIVS